MRVNLSLPDSVVKECKELIEPGESLTEFLRHATRYYIQAKREKQSGAELISIRKDGSKAIFVI